MGNHNDKGEGMPWWSVFIPIILSWGTDATFKHAAHPEEDFSVWVGDIMLFDQNIDHSLSTNMGPVGHSMSYGLALYIDKLPAKEKEAQ